jgi:hypothetical protein
VANNSFLTLQQLHNPTHNIDANHKTSSMECMQRELDLVRGQLAAATLELARQNETIYGLTTDLENALDQFERLQGNTKSKWADRCVPRV